MKKVEYSEEYKKDDRLIKILSFVAIGGLISSTVLGYGFVYLLDKNLNKDKETILGNEKADSSEMDYTIPIHIFDTEEEEYNIESKIKEIDSDDYIEYEEIRVKPSIKKQYEIPNGFELKVKEDGTVYGFRLMDKIDGSGDYITRFYPTEAGYSLIDRGSVVEVRIIPREIISYSVPEGFTLVEDESGIYAYGIISKPITKKLS